jgi:hypothetical protein
MSAPEFHPLANIFPLVEGAVWLTRNAVSSGSTASEGGRHCLRADHRN